MSGIGAVSAAGMSVAGETAPPAYRRLVAATMIGNLLEWYDFAVYAFVATILARHFFPNGSDTAALLATFATFGVGFLARPVGAIVIGRFADARGRKPALLLTIFIMALGTLGMGLLPTYEAIGYGAPVLLICLRLLQGFSSGGELGGSTAFLVEWAPSGRRGLFGAFQQTAVSGGVMLGSGVAALLGTILSADQMFAFGWRIPFLLGGLLLPFGVWLRRGIDETPAFRSAVAEPASPTEPARSPLLLTLHGCGFIVAWTTYTYLITTYMPVFTERFGGLSHTSALWFNTVALVVLLIATMVMGALSDRVGRKTLLIGSCIGFVLLIYPALEIISSKPGWETIVAIQIAFTILLGAYTGTAPAAIAEIFPTRSRSMLMSMSYGFTIAIFGGFAPYVATWLIGATGSPMAPSIYLIGASAITLPVLFASRETAHGRLR